MTAGAETTVQKKTAASGVVFNVPNQLTSLRLVLSIVLFCFIGLGYFRTGLILFLTAAGTDWLDGYWARKYGQVTVLGRILDPFVDKVIICGTYIFLAAEPNSGVQPWMVVVIVGRELLVTALRGFLEGEGADFSAAMSGKLKFVLQCAAASLSLYALHLVRTVGQPVPETLAWFLLIAVWSAVALTVYSGVIYIVAAVRLIRNPGSPDTRI